MMQKRVLILSFLDDYHAHAIQALLKNHGGNADIIDPALFPSAISLSHQGIDFSDITIDGKRLRDYHSIWSRRVGSLRLDPDISNPEEAKYAARESMDALYGALYAALIPIYNKPEAERRANFKPYQLRLAHACGLRVPDTLITTSPDDVLKFREKHREIIYKGFSGHAPVMVDTRPLEEKDLPDLWRLRYAPAIFQEYIEHGKEYRVTIVEGDTYAAEIRLSDENARYDWRMDSNYRVIETTLSADIQAMLLDFCRRLNLNSGSIDLRETPAGEVYFLEINPSGQFMFLDVYAGMDVASRFCQMLLQ